ncbi:MAG TPA: HD-GYP domain-containing protein [Nitrolancea sp.]|jgi:hypothetical protein|nr:HD-GYP domain-containing protein [Nitrolancea sp.]
MLEIGESRAALIVDLLGMALAAPDVPSAVTPILGSLVERTAADGAAYFQRTGEAYHARAASGVMPVGPMMDAILMHGLPSNTPVLEALGATSNPLFFDDVKTAPAAAGFDELGVASLAAAPVRGANGEFIGAFLMHTFAPHPWTEQEAVTFAAVAAALASLTARLVAEEKTLAAREGALRALGLALEHRDAETQGHTDRVTAWAEQLGRQFSLSESELTSLRWGAYLHDIGKIAIPDAILGKPGKFDAQERLQMQVHPEIGRAFAAQLGFLPSDSIAVIHHHHERWDGSGYPDRLKGEAIPFPARLFAVCDVYDALTSVRPYKDAWSDDEALAEIRATAGSHFDPAVVEAFERIISMPTEGSSQRLAE